MNKPLVSIIIVNWNGKSHLEICLSSLRKITYKKYEIILVDNGSTDGSVEYLKKEYPKIKIIQNSTNLGFAKANNQGIKTAAGDLVLFLNNDTKVTKNFLGILVKKISSNEKIGAVQPKILHMDKKGKLDSVGSFLTNTGFLYHFGFESKDSKKLSMEIKLFSGKGSCLLFKKIVLDEVGGFNEEFFAYFEETDLCWRLWLAGYYLIYVPEVAIYHKTWGTTKNLPLGFVSFHSFKNRIASLVINLELMNLIKILPLHLSICIFIAVFYLFKAKPSNSLAILNAFYWNIRNFREIIAERNRVQKKIRKIPDSLLFPEIIKRPGLQYYLYILKYSFVRSKVFDKKQVDNDLSQHYLALKYRPGRSVQNKKYLFFDTSFDNFKTLNYNLENWQIAYLERIFSELKLTVNDIFLDIGMGGYGWNVIEAARGGVRKAVGIDIDRTLVKRVQRLAKETLPANIFSKCKFVTADAQSLPFPDKHFTKISAIAVLEHIENYKLAVNEIKRVTKKGGLVFICVPNSYTNTPFFLKIINNWNDRRVNHFHHFDPSILIYEFQKKGFKIEKRIYHAHNIKLFQWLLTFILPFTNRYGSKTWWFLERIDNSQSEDEKSMNFSLVLRK